MVGLIASAALTVTAAFAVFPKASVTRTVSEPTLLGAVYTPVEELIVPPAPPETTE